MILNEDYKDIVQALNDEQVEFILVGAYALAAHGYPRATMDIDLWVMPSPKNALAVLRAIKRFGAPLHGLSASSPAPQSTHPPMREIPQSFFVRRNQECESAYL